MLIDTHCHLADKKFTDDRDEVVARAREAGVERIVAVGGGGPIEDSERSADMAAADPNLRSTAGIHPHDAKNLTDDVEARIARLLERPEVSAVGETGLDYYYEHSPRPVQREALARHLALGRAAGKPVVLHCRDAEADLREVLAAENPDGTRGVVHCFTGGYDDARWYLDHGLNVSFTGILTFPSAGDLRDVARRLPLDRLMVETDSPYLAPVPHRGRRNEPAFVAEVAEKLAEVLNVDLDELAARTTANAEALFFS